MALPMLILSCGDNKTKEPVKGPDSTQKKEEPVVTPEVDSTPMAKKWLTENIEQFFSNFDKLGGDYSKICTKEYYKYKTDATNVDMDGGMTQAKFEKNGPTEQQAWQALVQAS